VNCFTGEAPPPQKKKVLFLAKLQVKNISIFKSDGAQNITQTISIV
jgi:hypothetical protein